MFQNTIALKLNKDEFGTFLRNYKKEKDLGKVTKTHADFIFEKCDGDGSFLMHKIAPGEAVFMTFAPFAKAPKSLKEEMIFVVPAKRQVQTLADTFNGLYRSFLDLESEMKKNLGKWMPKSFNWKEHIGVIDGGSGIRIKHLTRKQRRSLIMEELKRDPYLSDRQIAARIGTTHDTVGRVREEGEKNGELPSVTHVYDTLGRKQPRDRIFMGDIKEAVFAREVAWYISETISG